MLDRIRVLPVLIISASLLLGVKVDDVWTSAANISFTSAIAQQQNETGAAQNGAMEQQTIGLKEGASENTSATAAEAAPAEGLSQGQEIDLEDLTRAELRVLQSLAQRRENIERKEEALRMRDAILSATEKRIDEKIHKLKSLEERIQALLKKHDADTERRIASLVKVYESMKPKDAARIFEELELEILIGVAERMKEAKVAAVMAKMDAKKARLLTVELATRKQLPEKGS